MNKNTLLFAFTASTLLLAQSCGNTNNQNAAAGMQGQQEIATPVSTAIVSTDIVNETISYPATVVPLQETEIRAEVTGYITNIFVPDGALVTKGQALYEIDKTRYQAAVDQAKANLNIAKATLDRGQKDLERYLSLAEKDAIAKQTLDYAVTDVNNQKAQVQAAEAALITANTNLKRSVIIAPFTGTIGISQVRNGALVSAGTSLLNTISSTNPIAIEFQINEKDISLFTSLQHSGQSSPIYTILPDGNRYESPGRIATIDRAVNSQTGTLKIRATFDNPNNVLRAGMNTTLNVQSSSSEEEIIIPYKAVFEQLGVFNVYTVNDSSRVEIKQVSLGHKENEMVVIKSGLLENEKIVIEGVASIRPGAKVTELEPTTQNK